LEFGDESWEFGVGSWEFGVWSLEIGVESLEFGVWSLEFGVWSWELGVLEMIKCEKGRINKIILKKTRLEYGVAALPPRSEDHNKNGK